jgi:hypothetical protein
MDADHRTLLCTLDEFIHVTLRADVGVARSAVAVKHGSQWPKLLHSPESSI